MGSALKFGFEAGLKVYVHRDAVDFRQSINGLSARVEQSLGRDPFAPAVYVFRNRCHLPPYRHHSVFGA